MTYQLHHGDCLEIMPDTESASVDAIIADLPYGVTALKWDSIIPLDRLWPEYKRILKPRGAVVLFGSQPFTSMLVMSNLEWFKYEWIWEKTRASNFMNAKNSPLLCHENIVVFSPSGAANGSKVMMTYNPQMIPLSKPVTERLNRNNPQRKNPKSAGLANKDIISVVYTEKYPRDVIKYNNVYNEKTLHPTQQPTALLEYLVLTYTNPGDTVLDNTFGSCTTGEACLRTGRNFIGIEMMEEYYNIGKARMERVERELSGAVDDLPMFAGTQANGQAAF